MENNTWVLVDLSPGCKPVTSKWMFKRKRRVDGTTERFKAWLVIRGFNQRYGIDYFDIYAPVIKIATTRVLIALAAIQKLVIHQMDGKIAFLNGELEEEEMHMKQPEGFVLPGQEKKAFKIIRTLYDLKQAPKQ